MDVAWDEVREERKPMRMLRHEIWRVRRMLTSCRLKFVLVIHPANGGGGATSASSNDDAAGGGGVTAADDIAEAALDLQDVIDESRHVLNCKSNVQDEKIAQLNFAAYFF